MPDDELERAAIAMKQTSTVEPGMFASLARRIHTALVNDQEPLPPLAQKIGVLLKSCIAQLPAETVEEISDPNSLASPVPAAFIVGQLSFAHQVISDAISRQADEDVLTMAKDGRYKPFLVALLEEPLSGVQLAEICKCRPETVSRKIGELRDLGLVEYRREGRAYVNYLTPFGRLVVESISGQEKSHSPIINPPTQAYQNMISQTNPLLRSFTNFGNVASRERAA